MSQPHHAPVLLERVVELLSAPLARPGAVLIDATLGLAGHSEAVLAHCPQARVIGIDRDPQALALARERLAPFADRFEAVHAVYDQIPQVIAERGLPGVDAVLFDLGVSSMQLDVADRGFAYRVDAALDMRMDPTSATTAADILNTYAARDLARVLRDYGDEKFARPLAAAIVRERDQEPFTNSARLVELIYRTIPAPARRSGGHPAKRTFQALRMEVNDELATLRRALPAALALIVVGGRVVVESYHSGEDRIVKRTFAEASQTNVPPGLPVVPVELQPRMRLVTRGAEQADAEEIADNPRAASVRLRAIERVRPERGAA